MIDHTINNPEFRKFLKRYDKPILVIDDCEIFMGDNWGRQNPTSSNLLQMVDGFLSESINCNIITIFNTDTEDDIDQSLIDFFLKNSELQLMHSAARSGSVHLFFGFWDGQASVLALNGQST
jgi:hypothetical protein